MASIFLSWVALGLAFFVLQISPAHSLTCISQSFKHKKLYEKCLDLPTLDSYLHYTYNAANCSLSVAFIATPRSSDGCVAWAINPTGTGKAGSQSLFAFKSYGSLKVKTYSINSYSSIHKAELPFDAWDLSAESGRDGAIIIYVSLKVPESARTLKVWQVSPRVSDDHPNQHEHSPENLYLTATFILPPSLSPTYTSRKLISFEKVQTQLIHVDRRIIRSPPPQPSGDPRISIMRSEANVSSAKSCKSDSVSSLVCDKIILTLLLLWLPLRSSFLCLGWPESCGLPLFCAFWPNSMSQLNV